jgi:hypothetical protein
MLNQIIGKDDENEFFRAVEKSNVGKEHDTS